MAIRRPQILITDDDLALREVLSGFLSLEGFETFEAGDGEEAVDIVRHRPVHLLLLDMHMPKLSGLETIRRVRQFHTGLPCILMSARADEQLVRDATSVKAFSVLAKPLRGQVVSQAVRNAMSRAYNWPDGELPEPKLLG